MPIQIEFSGGSLVGSSFWFFGMGRSTRNETSLPSKFCSLFLHAPNFLPPKHAWINWVMYGVRIDINHPSGSQRAIPELGSGCNLDIGLAGPGNAQKARYDANLRSRWSHKSQMLRSHRVAIKDFLNFFFSFSPNLEMGRCWAFVTLDVQRIPTSAAMRQFTDDPLLIRYVWPKFLEKWTEISEKEPNRIYFIRLL